MERIGRAVESHVRDFLLPTFAAVMVTGPRSVGKTTSMRDLTTTHLDLSVPTVRDAVDADPDAALSLLDRPVLIDEWQEVPDVVGAVKRAIDRDPSPGQFVLTGSVRGPLDAGLWGGTGRLIRAPKIHLTDAGLAAAMLGVGATALRLDGTLAGALLESFVAGELLKAAQTSVIPVELFHLRTQAGGEVDVLTIADDGRVVGFEVKAAAKVTGSGARGLRWLRDKLGDRFVAGYVTYTGPLPQLLDDRIWAIPLARLWR